jgi:hypothetical protein
MWEPVTEQNRMKRIKLITKARPAMANASKDTVKDVISWAQLVNLVDPNYWQTLVENAVFDKIFQ